MLALVGCSVMLVLKSNVYVQTKAGEEGERGRGGREEMEGVHTHIASDLISTENVCDGQLQ